MRGGDLVGELALAFIAAPPLARSTSVSTRWRALP